MKAKGLRGANPTSACWWVTSRTPPSRPEAHISVAELDRLEMGSPLQEGQVAITDTVRQAQLKPECAERYPTLPARMWTSATCVAELVDSSRGAPSKWLRRSDKERTLLEADFEFRGGFPRQLGGWFARTRPGELTYCGLG